MRVTGSQREAGSTERELAERGVGVALRWRVADLVKGMGTRSGGKGSDRRMGDRGRDDCTQEGGGGCPRGGWLRTEPRGAVWASSSFPAGRS